MHNVVLQVGMTVDGYMAELEGNLAANFAPRLSFPEIEPCPTMPTVVFPTSWPLPVIL